MLTTWGKKVASILRSTSGSVIPAPSISQSDEAFIEAAAVNGWTAYINGYASSNGISFIGSELTATGGNSSNGFAIGSGSKAESASDYNLEKQIVNITGSVSQAYVKDSENFQYIQRFTITVQNNTGEEITVREVGLFRGFQASNTKGGTPSTQTAARACIMVDRSLLANPVVIPNGEARAVQYDFAYDVS